MQPSETAAEAVIGTVVSFNAIKGYGFIRRHDNREEVFVHYTAICSNGYRELVPEQRVSFDVKPGPRGPIASNVRVQG
jgi:CspA family cold shock protein